MIVITGAAGFIGSALAAKLNQERFFDLILVDEFTRDDKLANLQNKKYLGLVHRNHFFAWLDQNHMQVQFIFHLGAKTDTTLFDEAIFNHLNVHYSQQVWSKCIEYGIPLVYASSAATYGLGEFGYDDNESSIPQLKPLNPYGYSKQHFDVWALAQEHKPYFFAGLKFFNVYGPNEYHKGRMASVVMHGYHQINENGTLKLFKSHKQGIEDGGQKRDFVYVKDVINVCYWLMHHRKNSGIYNLGSGQARTFLDLAKATFNAANKPANIEFIDTPLDIRDKYQYFTQAEMSKLKSIGYQIPFTDLEDGVADYVGQYLTEHRYL